MNSKELKCEHASCLPAPCCVPLTSLSIKCGKTQHKDQSLFNFETGTTTTVFDLPENLLG